MCRCTAVLKSSQYTCGTKYPCPFFHGTTSYLLVQNVAEGTPFHELTWEAPIAQTGGNMCSSCGFYIVAHAGETCAPHLAPAANPGRIFAYELSSIAQRFKTYADELSPMTHPGKR